MTKWTTAWIGAALALAFAAAGGAQETAWRLEGQAVTADNCNVGCPCIFGEAPSHGHCTFAGILQVASGHYGDVDLAGVEFALAGEFAREGGEAAEYRYVAYYFDSEASAAQRSALRAIFTGPAFAGLGTPAEMLDLPIELHGLEAFGQVGATYGGTVGDVVQLEVTPVAGAKPGEPVVIENSAEPLFEWTCLGEAQGAYRSQGGREFTFQGTSGESHRFALASGS